MKLPHRTDLERGRVTIVTGITSNPARINGARIISVDLSIRKLIGFRLKIGELLDELKPDITILTDLGVTQHDHPEQRQKKKDPRHHQSARYAGAMDTQTEPAQEKPAMSLYQRQSIT
jgi:hypothetical protein